MIESIIGIVLLASLITNVAQRIAIGDLKEKLADAEDEIEDAKHEMGMLSWRLDHASKPKTHLRLHQAE